MITFIKRILGKSRLLRILYDRARFLLGVLRNNLSNPQKALLFLRVLPYTMVSYPRIENVFQTCSDSARKGVEGSFVECGVWKGGVAAVMAFVAEKEGKGRQTWLFDSFEGLPEPSAADGEMAKTYASGKSSGTLTTIGQCVGPLEDVKKLFLSVLKLKGEYIHIEQGWFQNTLSKARENVGKIAVLRLDADWYESTKCALENLYDNVVPGGYVLIDDYGHWEGCRKAMDEFLAKRNIRVELQKIDYTGVYFQKP